MRHSNQNKHGFQSWVSALVLWMLVQSIAPAQAASSAGPKTSARQQSAISPALMPHPIPIHTPTGRSGWRVSLAGQHTLATPALYGDLLFLGGGFGSHEFYALSASSGLPVWTFATGDDGPTAAVAAEGCVAYNTESCIVYVHDARSGRLLWQKWLGDPLMSQPAIGNGLLYIAYPGRDGVHHLGAFRLRNGRTVWDTTIAGELISAPVIAGENVIFATVDGTLYRLDARSGKRYWRKAYGVTSAPRILGRTIYISQRQGHVPDRAAHQSPTNIMGVVEGLNLVDLDSGALRHAVPLAVVPAPYLLTLAGQQAAYADSQAAGTGHEKKYREMMRSSTRYLSKIEGAKASQAKVLRQRIEAFTQAAPDDQGQSRLKDADRAVALADELDELLQSTPRPRGEALKAVKEIRETARKAAQAVQSAQKLKSSIQAKRKEVQEAKAADAEVGFSQAPAAAKLQQAAENLGQDNVHSVWAYQGARPCLVGELAVMVHGDTIRAIELGSGRLVWQQTVITEADASRPLTPPALAGGKLFLGTVDGRILCLDPFTGHTLWQSKVGGHFVFEPAVEKGRVYLTTQDGRLICLKTNDLADSGWPMWGGSADHNGGRERRLMVQ